jgi:hypothetical protein
LAVNLGERAALDSPHPLRRYEGKRSFHVRQEILMSYLRCLGFSLALILALGTVTLLQGCCCGGEDKYDCWASTDLGNGPMGSRSLNADRNTAEDQAREGVCIGYCEYRDPKVDKAYKAWKATPKGKKSSAGRSFDVDFQAEIKPVYGECVATCNKNRTLGNLDFSEQCGFPASGKVCTAKIKYKKKKVSRTGDGELGSLMDACGLYCEKNDRSFKKAFKELKSGNKTATVAAGGMLLPEFQVCRSECMHAMVKTPANQDISCE